MKTTNSGQNWSTVVPGKRFSNIRDLVVGPEPALNLYALTGSGIYISEDNTQTWQKISHVTAELLVVDPQRPDVFYALVRENSAWSRIKSIMRSTNAGKDWQEIHQGLESAEGNAKLLILNPKDPMQLIMFGYTGLYRSMDAAASWKTFNLSDFPVYWSSIPGTRGRHQTLLQFAISPHLPVAWYAFFHSSIYTSTDDGDKWEPLSTDNIPAADSVWFHPDNPDIMYMSVSIRPGLTFGYPLPPNDYPVYKSTDAGKSWGEIGQFCCEILNDLLVGAGASDNFLVQSVAIRNQPYLPSQPLSGYQALRSLNGGQSWKPLGNRIISRFNSIIFDPKNSDRILAASADGIFEFTQKCIR